MFSGLSKANVLKDWDEPLSPSEVFHLHDLESFDSADMGAFISALNSIAARVSAVAIKTGVLLGRRARSPLAIPDKRPTKRAKLNETDTLLGLLPMVRTISLNLAPSLASHV